MRVRKGVGSRLEGARVRWAGKAGGSKPLPICQDTNARRGRWREGEAIRADRAESSSGYPELIQICSYPQGVRFHHPRATRLNAKAGQCSMGKQQQRGGAKQFMQGPPSDSEEEEEEVKGKSRQVNAQSRNAGEMPPNSSDEEEEEEAPKKGKAVTKQSGNAGMMPPGSSDEESDDEPKVRLARVGR